MPPSDCIEEQKAKLSWAKIFSIDKVKPVSVFHCIYSQPGWPSGKY